jgi:hypothetical protein
MALYIQPRQPFGALDGTRLQALGSIKNRQNGNTQRYSRRQCQCSYLVAITIHEDRTSPSGKPIEIKSNKRAFSPDTFDDFDSENVDPNILASPTKRAKGSDGTPCKTSKPIFNLITTPAASSPAIKRKALSLSVPTTSNKTPISHSRGSPKHKRVGLLSRGRRASSSPFRRVDPPSFNSSKAGALPFSIDAALSGTISSYKPAVEPTVPEASTPSKPLPKAWFFEIHEDTPEEEAANLMEHSASILDISSDDDSEAKQRKLESEIGKENVPPPDWSGPSSTSRRSAPPVAHKGIHSKAKAAQKEENAMHGDLMQDDRVALADMSREDFFPDGLDDKSVEVVAEENKLSGLSKETIFDFTTPSSAKEDAATETESEEIFVRPDAPEKEASS